MNADLPISGRTSREIAESIETGVETGDLPPRQALPSVRGLATRLGVSPTTVATAYRDLRMRGVVTSEAGRVTRIGTRPPVSTAAAQAARSGPSWYEGPRPPAGSTASQTDEASPNSTAPAQYDGSSGARGADGQGQLSGRRDLSGLRDVSDGNPDPAFLPDVQAVLRRLRVPRYLYGEPTILPELMEIMQAEFADVYAQAAGQGYGGNGEAGRGEGSANEAGAGETGDVCLVGSALDGVERVLAAWTRLGDRVVIEDPGHAGVLDLVHAMGLEPIGVRVDDAGPLPDDLDRAMQLGPAAVVVTPRAQNPTGAAIDDERAARLRTVLDEYPEVAVVEDDHAWLLAGVQYASLSAGRRTWAVVRSVSKHLGPDMRLGFLTGDRRTVSRVAGRQMLGAGWVSHILQHAAVELWRDDGVKADVQRAASAYRLRREQFVERLAERGIPAHGRSGFNVHIPVPQEAPVIQEMQARGWTLRAGELHRIRSESFVRVTTATLETDAGRQLAADLAAVLEPQRISHLA
ncbi:aminotransferase class I/II-fold pyridoxal phosphate-dependent enzyme [Phytoactinopolyspora endophytica]|uniref:aminotransferase class I/II-fold pyridoxal phosphate-dependent enzyme n=1 Tax=Phytoactinopolyspora endophytica TaxID=1642495 RepID=UPI0013ECB8FD|nr:aminotransferase class I/II-fold pyridoxal phosphate-dependent enzyme [Phytoactinopolyspora endophytica]